MSLLLAAAVPLAAGTSFCQAQKSFFDFLQGPRAVSPPAAVPPASVLQPVPKPRIRRPHTGKQEAAKVEAGKQEAKPESQPAADEPPPPYEPELLRLSEILGALTYLRDLCGAPDAEAWRAKMQALIDTEAKTESRREHLAGAYNRGFHGYELSYRACTANAGLIIERFLAEGEKIAHDVTKRYGAT